MADETPQALAAMVRAKYPGVYDDLSDEVLAGKIAGKYPEYRRFLKTPTEPESPSLGSLAMTALGQGAKSLVSAPVNLLRMASEEVSKGGDPMMTGARLFGRLVIDPSIEQGKKSFDAFSQGRVSEGVGHGLGMIPLIGPAAAHIGEQMGTGDPETMARGVGDLGALAAAGPAARLTGRVIRSTGNAAQDVGRSAWRRAAKITEPVAKRTNAYRTTRGDLDAAESEIAETVLSRGQGALTKENVAALRAEKNAASDAIGQAVDAIPDVSTMPALRAMAEAVRRLNREHDPNVRAGQARYAEMKDKWTEVKPVGVKPSGDMQRTSWPEGPGQSREKAMWVEKAEADPSLGTYQPIEVVQRRVPKRVTGRKLEDFAVASGQRNQGRFASDAVSPAVSRVDMAGGGAIRKQLKSESKPLAEASETFSEVKPALAAMIKARQRVKHADPIGLLPGLVGAAIPPVGLLMLLQRGGPLSRIAQGTYNAGGRLQSAAPLANPRAALLAQLLGTDEE